MSWLNIKALTDKSECAELEGFRDGAEVFDTEAEAMEARPGKEILTIAEGESES